MGMLRNYVVQAKATTAGEQSTASFSIQWVANISTYKGSPQGTTNVLLAAWRGLGASLQRAFYCFDTQQ